MRQNCSAVGCSEQGAIQAVVCEGWGPATLIPPNISLQRDTQKQKRREEGGRLYLKRNIIRVRRKGGGWRVKEKDNGERSRMVEID